MVLPGTEKPAAKAKDNSVEAKDVPEATEEKTVEETPESAEEDAEEDVSLEQVAINHEQRLNNIEATLFRLKNI